MSRYFTQSESHSHVSSGGSTLDLAKKYFATISKVQFDSLVDVYADDLAAFGYEVDEFDLGTGWRN